MSGRWAQDHEVKAWQEDGWVLLDGLVGTDEIDAAVADLGFVFPEPEAYFADPAGARERWLGRPPAEPEAYVWPAEGPGFRPEQHRWGATFPFPGSGALNRLCVHPAVVDFASRALETDDLRLYQASASGRYAGDANYEQPMHTDRNHSWLPARGEAPWWQLQVFLYLSDVHAGNAPTHVVPLAGSAGRATTVWGVMPDGDPSLYAAEQAAVGPRGSVLAYRSNVFHRGVDVTSPGAARFILGLSFKRAGQDWIGYHSPQHRSTSPDWVRFASGCSPHELALFGFPLPGHPIWNEELLDATAERYPGLDLTPWRQAL